LPVVLLGLLVELEPLELGLEELEEPEEPELMPELDEPEPMWLEDEPLAPPCSFF
jgi:hypothetical protein